MDSHRDRSNASSRQKMTPWNYIVVSSAGLLVAVGLLLLFVYKASDLIKNGIDGKVFYVLLVPLGLASAAFIFGGMRSYARFSGKMLSGTLELGGPVVIATMVVMGGFYMVPDIKTFSVTVRVYDLNGHPIRGGNITIYLGQDTRTSPIASNGEANFKEIPLKFRNANTRILADVRGYKLSEPQTLSLSASVSEVKLAKDPSAIIEAIRSTREGCISKINRAKLELSDSAKNYLNTCERLRDTVRQHNAEWVSYRRYGPQIAALGGNPQPPRSLDYASLKADLKKAESTLGQSYSMYKLDMKQILSECKRRKTELEVDGVDEKIDLPSETFDKETAKAIQLLPHTEDFFKKEVVGGRRY